MRVRKRKSKATTKNKKIKQLGESVVDNLSYEWPYLEQNFNETQMPHPYRVKVSSLEECVIKEDIYKLYLKCRRRRIWCLYM